MRRLNLAIILVLTVLTGACVASANYSYTPPDNAAGLDCIADCGNAKEECLLAVQEEYDACMDLYEFDQRRFSDCRAGRRGVEHDNGGGCAPAHSCPPPNSLKCTREYNECYRACGGQVR